MSSPGMEFLQASTEGRGGKEAECGPKGGDPGMDQGSLLPHLGIVGDQVKLPHCGLAQETPSYTHECPG